jgi:hypothetical protein
MHVLSSHISFLGIMYISDDYCTDMTSLQNLAVFCFRSAVVLCTAFASFTAYSSPFPISSIPRPSMIWNKLDLDFSTVNFLC